MREGFREKIQKTDEDEQKVLPAEKKEGENKMDLKTYFASLVSLKEAKDKLSWQEIIGDFPMAMQGKIIEAVDFITEIFHPANKDNIEEISEDQKKEIEKKKERLVDFQAKQAMLQYEKRFNMPNKEFAKQKIFDLIDKTIEKNSNPNQFKKIARLSFDVKGLKAVNDLNGGRHGMGDDYLKAVASVYKNENNPTFQWLKANKIEYLATDDGGDEFGIILWSEDKELDEAVINHVLDLFDQETNKLDVGECLSLSILKEHADKEKISIPKNFKFPAVVSRGGISLFEACYNAISSKESDIRNKIKLEGDYNERIMSLVGLLLDASDREMDVNKEALNNGLRDSSDPIKKILSWIYSRTKGERELKVLVESVQKIIKAINPDRSKMTKEELAEAIDKIEKVVLPK